MDTQQQPAGQEAWEKEKEPAVKVRTPLISEILKKVNNAKAKPQKVKILQEPQMTCRIIILRYKLINE